MHTAAISALAGAAGATTLTLIHESGRRVFDDAPRMDVLGMRALGMLREKVGAPLVEPGTLHRQTLAGDLLANSLYYSLVGTGTRRSMWTRGLTLGLLAGVGALVLPRPMGLGDPPHVESTRNKLMTVAYYVIGGLAAAAAADGLRRLQHRREYGPPTANAGRLTEEWMWASQR